MRNGDEDDKINYYIIINIKIFIKKQKYETNHMYLCDINQ